MACLRVERTRHQETVLKKTSNAALKKTGGTAKPKSQPAAVERPAQAYYRWKAACLAAVCDVPLTGDDVAVLNVVRMGDEPKRLSEIGQLLNRVDVPNLQYATRKLVRSGLIETEGGSSRKETRYRATATGRSVTEAYAALRAATLPPMLDALDGWAAKSETTSIHLDLISSLYAQAAQVAITRRHQP